MKVVRRHHVWLVLGATLLLWLAMLALGIWQLLNHWQATVILNKQPVRLSLPTGVLARADIQSVLQARLDIRPLVVLPFDQNVKVSVDQALTARSTVNTVLPIRTAVHFEGDIQVDTQVEMDVPIISWLPRFKVRLPVAASVPVKLTVPVDVKVPLVLDMPVQGRLDGVLNLPVRTRLALRLPVRSEIKAEVVSQADFTLLTSQEAFALDIRQARITTPLGLVSWHWTAPPFAGSGSLLLDQ